MGSLECQEDDDDDDDDDDPRPPTQAVEIQRHWRGYKGRVRYENVLEQVASKLFHRLFHHFLDGFRWF